jgi:AraC family transcriptional regulator
MNDRLVPADALHQFVPAERTDQLASTEKAISDGRLLVERYLYPASIPEQTSPPIDAHSIVILLEGQASLERRLGDGSWAGVNGAPGVASLRPAGRSLALRGNGQGLDVLTIRFPPSLLRRIAAENETAPTTLRLRDTAQIRDPVLARLGQAIREEMESEGAMSSLVLTSIVESIVTRLFVNHCVEAHEVEATGPLSSETVDRIRSYVHAHLTEDIRVADLADCANMGVSHFTRLFKQTLGQSPYQYVLHERVNAARRQLENTEAPIAQIALDVGFSSQSHLTRRFKKIVGTTPGRYRTAHQ